MKQPKFKVNIDCTHVSFKVRKHRDSIFSCLHCLSCNATWSDPSRALSHLKHFKMIVGL